ncbi:MAG: OPT/YSL family transporter [Gemmatimonadota bacterium]|nr:MAG: OPT/YSL family transporter [Gemmatimonadota bacterium]
MPGSHPRTFEPATLALLVAASVVGAIIGLQILTTLGITPNTSIIGVLVAILVSRVPIAIFRRFRSIHRQNLVQTNISSATFGAANSLLVPIGVPVLIGRPDLVAPMLIGATLGMLIDVAMLYWFFDSRLFPGHAPWPVGIAAAEAIRAGDEAGRRGAVLGAGAAAGVAGSSGLFGGLGFWGASGIPMAALGIAFLGNVWALALFGIGLLVRAYAPGIVGVDLNQQLIPHGIMIGAGLVALGQAVVFVVWRSRRSGAAAASGERTSRVHEEPAPLSRSDRDAGVALLRGIGLYVVAALLLTAIAGFWTEMSPPQLVGWALFAAVACIAAEFIVGFSAMHAGWFPAFATALVFLIVGLALGFPAPAAGLLVGFVASGGPAFADAGYDLKAGWYLRGHGRRQQFERAGRRQQIIAAVLGLLAALVVVSLFHDHYFDRDMFPPVVRVYAVTIQSGIDSSSAGNLLLWAIPGALIQLIGGGRRQLGVLFATGLLVLNAAAGWVVLLGIVIRIVLTRGERVPEGSPLTVLAAGFIAGDALWAFGSSVLRL